MCVKVSDLSQSSLHLSQTHVFQSVSQHISRHKPAEACRSSAAPLATELSARSGRGEALGNSGRSGLAEIFWASPTSSVSSEVEKLGGWRSSRTRGRDRGRPQDKLYSGRCSEVLACEVWKVASE